MQSTFIDEKHLCSKNGCFLRWLTQKTPDLDALDAFVCDRWVVEHGPKGEQA